MSKQKRRHYRPEEKAALLRRHLIDKVPVSQICTEEQMQPSVFYQWQRDLVEGAAVVFGRDKAAPGRERELEKKIEYLNERLAKKDAIIADVSEEYVTLKKELGEL